MRVCAWGYETPDMAQGYPYTYMSNAQAIGLMDGVDMVANTDALRGEDAQVIYNALFADYARGAKLVNTTHGTSVEQYPTLAESVWGLERAAVGVWQKDDRDDATMELTTCKAHTWVITGKSIEVGNVNMFEAYPIEDDETYLYKDGNKGYPYLFTYNGDMENIADLKGYQVELWGMGAHDEPELETVTDENGNSTKAYVYSSEWDINAIKTVKGQTAYDYTPADEDLPDVDLDDVHGFFGGTEFKGENLKWGDKALDEDDVKDAMQTRNSASYRVADWDSDGAADFIVGDIYDYYKVDAVTNKTVRLIDMNDEKFVLDLDGETDVKIGGQDYTVTAEFPDDIEEGDIIQVSKSDVVGKKKIASTWTIEVVEAETKELTKVDTKKGAYFDDELIHDAEFYNDVRYYFEEDERNIDGLDVYDELNETSVDNWDLYRDANGFIIDMEESDEAWAGYIYVTGAANGRDKTGSKRQYAEISGVNDKNEYMENITVVKDADIEINGKDAFDDYAFDDDVNPKGRVFHYVLNEDNEITKMIEVATENGDEDYTYTDKTDAVRVNNRNYWLDEADIIFAVEITDNEFWNDKVYDASEGDVNVSDGLGSAMSDTYRVGGQDLDEDSVIAVTVDEIPDIGDNEVTKDAGIRYDDDLIKDEDGAVVLGVNTLRYFSHTSVETGLLTNLTSNRGDDTYTATAYIAGRDGTEFVTIDEDDVTIHTKAGNTKLDELYDILNKGSDAKYGIYCEFEFNKDGEITALSPMEDTEAAKNGNGAGIQYNEIDETDIPATYKVMRTVVNKVTADKALTVSGATATGVDNKVYTVENAQYVGSYDIDDSTAYYKITDEKVNMEPNQVLNAWADGFKDGYGVEEGSVDELDSYIRNYSDKYDDEYVVADVILDGEDVVAVYYYDELVGEYGYLNGSVQVSDVAYSEQTVDATITCTNDEFDTDRVYAEIWSTKADGSADTKLWTSDVTSANAAGQATITLPKQDAGNYVVYAYGWNTAADEYQLINNKQWRVYQDRYDIKIIDNNEANGYPELTSLPVGSDTVWVKVTNLDADAGVAGLDATDFSAKNNQNLAINVTNAEPGFDVGYYELTLSRGVQVGDNLTITVKETTNNISDYDEVNVAEAEAATKVATINKVSANVDKDVATYTGRVNGASANVTYKLTITGGTISSALEREIEVTDEISASELAAKIVAAVGTTHPKVEALQGADNDTFTFQSKGGTATAGLEVSIDVIS